MKEKKGRGTNVAVGKIWYVNNNLLGYKSRLLWERTFFVARLKVGLHHRRCATHILVPREMAADRR